MKTLIKVTEATGRRFTEILQMSTKCFPPRSQIIYWCFVAFLNCVESGLPVSVNCFVISHQNSNAYVHNFVLGGLQPVYPPISINNSSGSKSNDKGRCPLLLVFNSWLLKKTVFALWGPELHYVDFVDIMYSESFDHLNVSFILNIYIFYIQWSYSKY